MPFQPGQSGNPRGRPKKDPLLTRALLRWAKKKGPDGTPNYDLLAEAIGAKALAGDMVAAGMIFDRVEGKPVQPVHHGADEDAAPIPFIVVPPAAQESAA
jgi:hypothetical protein